MTVPSGARVSVFLGKGGVGKTTLATSFAVDRAAAGERVLLTSLTSTDDLLHRLQAEAQGAGVGDRLEVLELNPRALVDDIVRKLTRLGALGDFILKQPGYESLVEIAPGIREMAVFNLVWNKRQQGYGPNSSSDGPRYDRVIVDGPATGHGLHWLEAPGKTAQILVGKLRERALAIRDMLRDPQASEAVIVTLAEEMPIRESLELADVLRREGYPLDNVVVNKWLPAVFQGDASSRAFHRLAADADARRDVARAIASDELDVDAWVRALHVVAGQREEAVEHVRTLSDLDAKLAVVPYLPRTDGRLLEVAKTMKDTHHAGDVLDGEVKV